MSHQAFAKSSGSIPDGYVLSYSAADGYWKPSAVSASAGWQTVYEVNFANLSTQAFSADGNVTIDGKTWTVANFANTSSFGIVNGEGLKFVCNANSNDYNNGTRTTPLVTTPVTNIYSNFDIEKHEVRLSVQLTQNGDANYELLFSGFEHSTSPTLQNFTLGRGYSTGDGFATKWTLNSSTQNPAQDTTTTTDDVNITEMTDINRFVARSGLYSSGWPSNTTLRRVVLFTTSGDLGFEKTSDINLVLAAAQVNTSASFIATVKKLRLEVRGKGGGATTSSGGAGGDLIGSYPSPVVAKIRGTSVSSAAPVDGQYLKYNSGASRWEPTTVSTALSRRVATDGYSQLVWKLDDLASPFVNSGTAGSLDATTGYGTPVTDSIGIFNRCVDFQSSGLKTADTSLGESNLLTVSAWVNLRSFGTNQDIYDKKYQTGNTWSPPYIAHGLTIQNSSGQWVANVTVGGTLYSTVVSTRYAVTANQWNHLGFTYDATTHTCKAYINGRLAATDTSRPGGNIDYGSHGSYQIGAVTTQSTQGVDGRVDDLRIENTIRDDYYFESVYKAGIAAYDTLNTQSASNVVANRVAATGSGATFASEDTNVLYIDDPSTKTWHGHHTMGPISNTFPTVGNFTVVGTMGVLQKGDSILATTQVNNKDHHGLATWPAGVPTSGPWVLTVSGSWSFTRGSTFPSFGALISNGVTAASSLGLFMGYYNYTNNNPSPGVWTITLNTQTRPSVYFFDNGFTADTSPSYFRIINDGTNYIYQFSQMKGSFWRTVFSHTTATVGITPTHYGFSLGCTNTAGFASALVDGISLTTLSQSTITNVTFASSLYTVTTSANHNLITGDSVSINSVTGTGTSPNARYENTVIVTGSNTFTLPAGGSFTYTSGGTVTLTSR